MSNDTTASASTKQQQFDREPPYMVDMRVIAKHYASATLLKDQSDWPGVVILHFADNAHAEFAFEVLSIALTAGLAASARATAPSQSAPLDKEAEKQKFIAWGQVFHRNARSYTARDFDHGFLGWLAAKSDAALARAPMPAQGGAPLQCWICKKPYTLEQRADADGNCPHCGGEIELDAAPAQADEALNFVRSVIEDGYLSDTNTARGRAILDASIAASLAGKDKK